MITKKLKELVRIEADNLRKYATKEELRWLDFEHLRPLNVGLCIYGQMTDNCFSDRASELVQKCAKSYCFPLSDLDVEMEWDFKNYKDSWLHEDFQEDRVERLRFFSPIEVYIGHKNAKSKSLIEYLRGETDTLEL